MVLVLVGRRIVPPGERPSTGVAAKKGRERPRLRRANLTQRPGERSRSRPLSVAHSVREPVSTHVPVRRPISGHDLPEDSRVEYAVGRWLFSGALDSYSRG